MGMMGEGMRMGVRGVMVMREGMMGSENGSDEDGYENGCDG